MKASSETAESSAAVEVDGDRVEIALPADFALPPDGLHLRWPDPPLAQERRMQEFKIYAAAAYARANGLNRLVFDSPRPRIGIIACGKAWLDVRQALDDLGIDARVAADIGLRLYKVGMPWPLEADGVRRFARGLEEILVVEEKRQIIEYQLKEMLYDWRDAERPRVVGKFDESGEWPAPAAPVAVAADRRAVAGDRGARDRRAHRALPRQPGHARASAPCCASRNGPWRGCGAALQRTPYFCSGCPHNQSTRVPAGSCALAGVGCHLMAVGMDRNTLTISQMGGEGVTWLGMAEHSGTQHVFANMGDGTYFHSGLLAIRAAVAAGVNVTYKLLFNHAVAMTGGQPVDGDADGAAAHAPARSRRRAPHRGAGRRHRQISRRLPALRRASSSARARTSKPCSANCARHPASRRWSTTRPVPRSNGACASAAARPNPAGDCSSTKLRLRRLRRLQREVELPVGGAGGHRVRHQARDRPVHLQHGLQLPRRLLSQHRQRRRRVVAAARKRPPLRHGTCCGFRRSSRADAAGAGCSVRRC